MFKKKNHFEKIIKNQVYAVIIIYNPDYSILKNSFIRISKVFSKIIVICNSKIDDLFIKNFKKIKFLHNRKNIGLAKAINKGIRYAKNKKATHVVLFDQDTKIKQDFLNKIKNITNKISFNNTAAIGPMFYNKLTKKYGYNWKFNNQHNIKYFQPKYLITSGTLIPIEVFKKIGLMREKMNIDLIDLDWCNRARQKGYKFYCLPSVVVEHHIGFKSMKLFGKILNIHEPRRNYYYFRNSIFVYKQKYNTFDWITFDIVKNVIRFIFYLLLVQPRKKYLYFMLLGLIHGLKGEMKNLK